MGKKWASNFSFFVHLVSGWLREWLIMEASQNVGSNFRLIPGKQKGSKIYVKCVLRIEDEVVYLCLIFLITQCIEKVISF